MSADQNVLLVDAAENEDDVRTYYELPDALVERIRPHYDTLAFDQALHLLVLDAKDGFEWKAMAEAARRYILVIKEQIGEHTPPDDAAAGLDTLNAWLRDYDALTEGERR